METPYDPLNDIESDRNERAKNERRIDVEDMKWLLKSPRGRRILWRLMSWTGIFRLSFNHSGSIMAFNEGTRYVGLTLLSQIAEADPMAYATMTKEQQDYDRLNTGDGRSTSAN